MNDVLVSVVIPVYNVEKYLNRCVRSVINQTYKQLEIILVDDGSPDSCPRMCDEWQQKDSRIKVIHKNNQGLGMARNTGLDNAKGNYVCFVDSDDYIDKDTIETSLKAALDNDADIVVYGIKTVNNEGQIVKSEVPKSDKYVFYGQEIINELVPDMLSVDYSSTRRLDCGMSMCELLISMELIINNKWRMVSERDIISEDFYSLISLYSYTNSVVIIPRNFYYYCRNDLSLTHVYNPNRYKKIKEFYDLSLQKFRDCGYTKQCEKRMASVYLSFVIGAVKSIISSDASIKKQIEEINEIVCDDHLRNVLNDIDKRNETIKRRIVIDIFKARNTLLSYICFKLQG